MVLRTVSTVGREFTSRMLIPSFCNRQRKVLAIHVVRGNLQNPKYNVELEEKSNQQLILKMFILYYSSGRRLNDEDRLRRNRGQKATYCGKICRNILVCTEIK